MCQVLASIDWLDMFQTIAALFAVYIAYAALTTWKHQAKAHKKTEFLDELTDYVHEYIQALAQPVEHLKFIYIGIESHKGLQPQDDQELSHVIAYITAKGAEDASRMWEYINNCSPLVAKIESLVVRGQVYGFINYGTCQDSIKMLLWQHRRLQVVASMIGLPSLNWQNAKVVKGIENMLTVQPDDIEEHLKKYDGEFIRFVQQNYKDVYAGT